MGKATKSPQYTHRGALLTVLPLRLNAKATTLPFEPYIPITHANVNGASFQSARCAISASLNTSPRLCTKQWGALLDKDTVGILDTLSRQRHNSGTKHNSQCCTKSHFYPFAQFCRIPKVPPPRCQNRFEVAWSPRCNLGLCSLTTYAAAHWCHQRLQYNHSEAYFNADVTFFRPMLSNHFCDRLYTS